MLKNGIIVAAVMLLPAMAMAQARGPWELELSGQASHGATPRGVEASGAASIGYFIGDTLEISGREVLTYNDIGTRGGVDTNTDIAMDLHFPLGDQGQIVPYVGANIGFIAGPNVHDTFEAGPEAGIKFFVNNSVFIFVSVEYEFFFDQHSNSTDAFKNGEFLYNLGIGFRF